MKLPRYYILDEKGEPIPASTMKLARWFESANRLVALDTIGRGRKAVQVSTVFLGLDHNYSDTGLPILWETMIFSGPLDQKTARCSGSREQAEAMHHAMVEKIQAAAI